MQLSKAQMRQAWVSDKKKKRKQLLVVVGITLAVFLLCIGFRTVEYKDEKMFVPFEHYHSFILLIRLNIAKALGLPFYSQCMNAMDQMSLIKMLGALSRLKTTFMAFIAGAGLAVAGSVFQTIYKNPMASPNMLGATAGVQLGNIIMVTLYSYQALSLIALRYKYCYILTAVCVAGIILLGKISGDRKGNPSVMQMVMAGSVISQAISSVTMYYMYQLEDEDLQLYQAISMGTYIQNDAATMIVFFAAMGAGLIPMLLMRYRFNVTGIDDAEARVSGVNPAPYRLIGQICSVLMVTAATIHCGEAGMLTMVIPYVVRAVVGADFRRVFTMSIFGGGALMMFCRTISSVAILRDPNGNVLLDSMGLPMYLPATFIINICLTPIFMVILAKQRRAFD